MDNANTKDYLDKIRSQVVENLKRTAFAPSVQMTDVPRHPLGAGMDDEADDILDDEDEDDNKDKRFTQRRFDQYVEKPGELSESEDEEENAANGVRRQPNAIRRRNQTNYRNLDPADSGLDSGLATPQEASSVGDVDMDTGLDINMGDAPRTEPDALAVPGVSNGHETPATDTDQMVVENNNNGPSTTSPPDEDTAMEDAGAPTSEPAPVAEMQEEVKPQLPSITEDASKAPLSPPELPKEPSVPATEQAAKIEPTPVGATQSAETITEPVEKTKLEE